MRKILIEEAPGGPLDRGKLYFVGEDAMSKEQYDFICMAQKKTNEERIRSMPTEELAKMTMRHNDELGEYICSDGKFYADYLYEEALKHEITWLKSTDG